MPDRDIKGGCFLSFSEGCGLGVLPVRFVYAGDKDTGKCAVIVNGNGDIGGLTVGGVAFARLFSLLDRLYTPCVEYGKAEK